MTNVHRWEVPAPHEIAQPRASIEVVWAEEYDRVVRENQRLQREVDALLASKSKWGETR